MVVKDDSDQKEVIKLSLLEQAETILLPKTISNLGFLSTHNGRILVESPTSGIDNIFEVSNLEIIQLTSARFGAYSPSVFEDSLIYNDYTASGMNIVSKNLPWDEKQISSNSFVPFYEKFAQVEASTQMDKKFFEADNYPTSDYSQVQKSVNLHSWFFIAPPLSSTIIVLGTSRDVLNKFSLSVGASHDLNEKESQGFVSAAWSHYYPVFDLRSAYSGRSQNIVTSGGSEIKDHWEEGTFEGGVQVPWKMIAGRFTHSLNLRTFGKVIKVNGKNSPDATELKEGGLFSPGAELQYSFLSRLARRDLNAPLGFSLMSHLEEGKEITGKDMKGSILTTDSRVFLPGFFKHHSFFHQLAYEKQRDHSYQYASSLIRPRGTTNLFLDESRKYSGNYLLPMFYPDWHLSRYAYLKRISMNLFFDEMSGKYRSYHYHAASTGWEVLLDTHLLRIFVPITLGVRGSYVLYGDEKKNNYELFFTTLGGYF
jgi:hypothetical protein